MSTHNIYFHREIRKYLFRVLPIWSYVEFSGKVRLEEDRFIIALSGKKVKSKIR